jgi:hypothetical protein
MLLIKLLQWCLWHFLSKIGKCHGSAIKTLSAFENFDDSAKNQKGLQFLKLQALKAFK